MKKIVFAIVALICPLFLSAQGQMQVLPNDPAVKVGHLENGLTYYIMHNELPAGRAEFYLATNVGAIQETPDQDGLAHFLEHMCFNGTKNFPDKSILDYLQSIGASFGGNVNASTGVEQTQYMLNNIPLVRQSVVDSCLLILHDYSHFVNNDPVEIDKERGVILEERRARRNAAWRLREQAYPYWYGDSKYAGCTIIGSAENLQTFKPESLKAFYETWYRPDLQAVVVVGDVDVDYVEAKIQEVFADIPAAVNPKPKDVIMVPGHAEPSVGILTDPEQTSENIMVFWESDASPKELNNTVAGALTDLLKNIFTIVMNERLSEITAQPDAPFLNADAGIGNLTTTCEVVIAELVAKEGQSLNGFAALMTEMEKARRYGFTDAEVERAKTVILSQYESAAKNADTRKNAQLVPGLINHFFSNYAFMEPDQEYALVQQLLPMVPAAVVNQVVASAITEENMVVVYQGPEKEGLVKPSKDEILSVIAQVRASDIQANAEEEIAADLLDVTKLKGSAVKKVSEGVYGSSVWTLKNGLRVVLYPTDYDKDRISFRLYKKGGMSAIATADLASFEENIFGLFLQNSGVSEFTLPTLSKMLSGKNVSVAPEIGQVSHAIVGSSTQKDLETAFQLAYLYFVDPRFDINEYNQGINTISAVLPNLVSQPNYKLQQSLYELIYQNNPRRRMIDQQTVDQASLATIERVYRSLFNDVAGAELIIVGDFLPLTIKPLIEKYFGSLPKGKKATEWNIAAVPAISDKSASRDFAVDMQTPMTTVVDVYKAKMPFGYDRQVAAEALSYILDMRYVTSLREEEGGTYGAQTATEVSFVPDEYVFLQVVYNCKPSLADRLRELALKDIVALSQDGPTESEFDMAKKNLEKNIPESRIRNSYWMNALLMNGLHGKDLDRDYENAVEALSAEDVRNLAKALLDGANMEIVMRPGATAEAE